MSYLELPHLFAATANTVGNATGNTAGVVAALGVVVEADGQAVTQLPSFSQLLQGGAVARLEADTDAVALIAGQAVDNGAGLQMVGNVRRPTAELAAVDSAIMTQGSVDPQIAALALTFGTATPVIGKDETGSRENTSAELDADLGSASDALDAEMAEMIWPGLALFMDSRAALQGANAAKFEPSVQSATMGANSTGNVIRVRIGAGSALSPVLVAGDQPQSETTIADTMGRTLTDSSVSSSLVASTDAVVGVTDDGGDFKSSLANLTTGTFFGGKRSLLDSAVVNALQPLPTDSPEPAPVTDAAPSSLLSSIRFTVQDAARPTVLPVDRPELVSMAVTPPVTERGKTAPVATPIEQPDLTPVVAKTSPAPLAVPPVNPADRAPRATVIPPVTGTVKTAPVAAPVEQPEATLPVAKTPPAPPAVPPVNSGDRTSSATVIPPVTETVKTAPVATPVEQPDSAPVMAKTSPAPPAVPPVNPGDRTPSAAVIAPVTERGKTAPVATSVEQPDSAPVMAKTSPAPPAVPPVNPGDRTPSAAVIAPVTETVKTTSVAAPVEQPDSAPVMAKTSPAPPAVPPVKPADRAPSAGVETVSRLAATVAMATPVIDVAKKMIAGQQDRTPIRLDAPSVTLSSALSASTAIGVTAAAVAESDTAIQDEVAANRGAPQIMGGRPLQPLPADPFDAIEPTVTVQTDSAVQSLAGEAQPASVPVTTGSNFASSDQSTASTIHDSSLLVAAAAQARPQSAKELDAESPQLAKPSAEPVVIQTTESTIPAASGPAITPPASVTSAAPSRPEATTTPTFAQTTPDTVDFQQSNWERALSHQLNWMVNNRTQEAQIRVNPPDLGPIEVRMSLQQNQTNVAFVCHESAVREAIENALPRLREMLNGQGILLNQAQVSDQSLARQQSGFGEQPYSRRESGSETATPDRNPATDADEQPLRPRRSLGMVDHYV